MIHILVTGGTIDDLDYINPPPDDFWKNHKSLIAQALEQSRLSVEYTVEELMAKDSRFVTDSDREIILNACKKMLEDKIVITHGTMSLPVTAKYIGRNHLSKTIVLVGSMIPLNKTTTDAFFNLGGALVAVQLLPHGVYVAMNGKIFTWDNVRKNLENGYFETES